MSNDSKTGNNPQREQAQERHQNQDITEGDQFVAEEHDGSKFTINPTADNDTYPEGSQYISRVSSEGDKDPTMIVGPEGDILNEAPEDSDDGGDEGDSGGDSDGGDSDGGDGGDGGGDGGDGGE